MKTDIKSWAILLFIWQCSHMYVADSILLPGPWETFTTLYTLFFDVKFLGFLAGSISTLFSGWILANISILICTAFMLFSHKFTGFITDIALGFQSLPTFSIAPVLMIALGFSKSAALIMLLWSVVWYGILHASGHLKSAKSKWDKHADNLGWSDIKRFSHIYMPALLPDILVISQNSWAMMWKTLIAIELLFGNIGGTYGLGSYMMEMKTRYQTADIWAVLLVIMLTGISVHHCFKMVISRIDW
jgi:NitT/TauT family transport system permease protein